MRMQVIFNSKGTALSESETFEFFFISIRTYKGNNFWELRKFENFPTNFILFYSRRNILNGKFDHRDIAFGMLDDLSPLNFTLRSTHVLSNCFVENGAMRVYKVKSEADLCSLCDPRWLRLRYSIIIKERKVSRSRFTYKSIRSRYFSLFHREISILEFLEDVPYLPCPHCRQGESACAS